MLRKPVGYSNPLPVALLFLAIFRCMLPSDPNEPSKTSLSLLLEASDFQRSDTAVTDTVGKPVRLGLCLHLTQHIDSTVVSVSSSGKNDTTIICREKDNSTDTIYYELVFSTSGIRTVSAMAYVGKELQQATEKMQLGAEFSAHAFGYDR